MPQLWPVLIAEGAAPAARTMAPGWGRLLSLTASRPHVDLDKAEIRCGRRTLTLTFGGCGWMSTTWIFLLRVDCC